MRSHVVANAAGFDDKFEPNPGRVGEESVVSKEGKIKMMGDFSDGQSGYGLRENPRKTWRAVDSGEERVCKRCGKAFQSMKALCGHMACHSDRDRGTGLTKDDQSWTSENQKMVLDSCSDTEAEGSGMRMRTRLSRNRRCKKVVDEEESNLNGSSSVSEIDEHDQEEVAMCLMMLSMDNGSKGGVNSVVESSDNNSVIVETKSSSKERENENDIHFKDENRQTMKIGDRKVKGIPLEDEAAQVEDSDSAYFLEECTKAEESDVSFDGIHKYSAFDECKNKIGKSLKLIKTFRTHFSNKNSYDEDDMASIFAGIESRKRKYNSEHPDQSVACNKKSRYECFNCKKTFKSYQALGGHRPCHKRTNTVYDPGYESDDNSLDDSTEYRAAGKLIESSSSRKQNAKKPSACNEKKMKPKNNKGHVCPFCNRVFKNGQALGGHKRSHFIGGHDENSLRSSRGKAELPDTLDLNLPAPEVDEDD